jgi:hypothetical protein
MLLMAVVTLALEVPSGNEIVLQCLEFQLPRPKLAPSGPYSKELAKEVTN